LVNGYTTTNFCGSFPKTNDGSVQEISEITRGLKAIAKE